jgi:hypothetical protein
MIALNKNEAPVALELARFQEHVHSYSQVLDVISGETQALGDTLILPARSARLLELR